MRFAGRLASKCRLLCRWRSQVDAAALRSSLCTLSAATQTRWASRRETELRCPSAAQQEDDGQDEEQLWKTVLTPEEFDSLRLGKISPPFAPVPSEVVDTRDNRLPRCFVCAGCRNPLFSSDDEVAGNGWRSFSKPMDKQSLRVTQTTTSTPAASAARSPQSTIRPARRNVSTEGSPLHAAVSQVAAGSFSASVAAKLLGRVGAPTAQLESRTPIGDSEFRVTEEFCNDVSARPQQPLRLLRAEANGLERKAFKRCGGRLRDLERAKQMMGARSAIDLRRTIVCAQRQLDRPVAAGMMQSGSCGSCGGFVCRVLPAADGSGTNYVCNSFSMREIALPDE